MKRGTVKKLLAVMLSVGTIAGGFSWEGTTIWAAELTEGNEAGIQPEEEENKGTDESQDNSSEYQDISGTTQNEEAEQQPVQTLPESLENNEQNA